MEARQFVLAMILLVGVLQLLPITCHGSRNLALHNFYKMKHARIALQVNKRLQFKRTIPDLQSFTPPAASTLRRQDSPPNAPPSRVKS
ncbi:hypothetical protein JCGZ_23536 [Jatropha curcas]|uniref:Uncharacterized protein n=1 Tax=Jatropha curcas TaxID=180498 RepID=A0A067JLQ4_JATCU|nr:hypothetical protein JCGZ_23536 [Jatropha curcas]